MEKRAIHTEEVTLENWQFALAPLQEDEQRDIHTAIAGMQKLTEYVQIDTRVGELDFVAGCFADIITQDLTRKTQIRKLLNHTLARGINARQEGRG
jgi:hypothetical protein